MSFLEIIKTIINPLTFLLKWWKEKRDQKAKIISQCAKKLLEETDKIMHVADSMKLLALEKIYFKNRSIASTLWESRSITEFLNACLSNAWLLNKYRKTKPHRLSFEKAVEHLRQTAIQWNEADKKWRESVGILESECLTGGNSGKVSTSEKIAKRNAAKNYLQDFDIFLKEYQMIHNLLQPLIRE